MATKTSEAGRPGQRRRTRSAILAAAGALLAKGRTPTVAEVADAADVSRRTVYMYFPTLEQLVIDATLGAMTRDTVDAALDAAEVDDAEARVDALVRATQAHSGATEQMGRTLMRLTAAPPADGESRAHPPRGYRRVEWIERALAPLRPRLQPARFERLVSALAMVIGFEALVVQRDVRGLSVEEGEEVSAWAARALVRAALEEAESGKARPSKSRPAKPRPRRA